MPGSKYFRLCRLPGLCDNHSTPPLYHKRLIVRHEQVHGSVFNKMDFMGIDIWISLFSCVMKYYSFVFSQPFKNIKIMHLQALWGQMAWEQEVANYFVQWRCEWFLLGRKGLSKLLLCALKHVNLVLCLSFQFIPTLIFPQLSSPT